MYFVYKAFLYSHTVSVLWYLDSRCWYSGTFFIEFYSNRWNLENMIQTNSSTFHPHEFLFDWLLGSRSSAAPWAKVNATLASKWRFNGQKHRQLNWYRMPRKILQVMRTFLAQLRLGKNIHHSYDRGHWWSDIWYLIKGQCLLDKMANQYL